METYVAYVLIQLYMSNLNRTDGGVSECVAAQAAHIWT